MATNVMAVLQNVDLCMRCNGCVIACKREWNLKNPVPAVGPDPLANIKPQKSIVNPRQRLAIKSQKRVDMGPFIRFTCWHCPDPPCAAGCPLGAIRKEATGAVSVDNTLCKPSVCSTNAVKPCQFECQRGGYPKVGDAYESDPVPGNPGAKMNKCTLCHGRAGADGVVTSATPLPTRQPLVSGQYESPLWVRMNRPASWPMKYVPEEAHEPACVSSCPAKAMTWDTRDNVIAYLNDPANKFILADGTKNWLGNGSLFWASKGPGVLTPPKADPFIEDHLAPMASGLLSGMGGKLLLPTLFVGGLAALSARRSANESESLTEGEV